MHFRRSMSRFLIMHAKEDVVTDPAFSQKFYDEAVSPDKSIKLFEGAYPAVA